MPLGLPVEPEVYSRNSGCSALTQTGSHTGLWPSMSSCHQKSRASFMRHVLAGALQHHHAANAAAALRQRLVGGFLELDDLAGAPAAVGRDQHGGGGVLDAVLERQRREPAEYHRMNRADARAGVHRDNRLDGQRHVDDHAVALLHAQRLQRVGEAAHVGMQLAIGHVAHVARLAHEGDRGLVAALLEVHVQAVVRNVQLAVDEPAVVRRPGLVQSDGERLVPAQLGLRLAGPETLVVRGRFGLEPGHVGRLQAGSVGEFVGRGETSFFDENGFDVLLIHGRGV